MVHFSLRLKAFDQPLLQRATAQVQSVLQLLKPVEQHELAAAQAAALPRQSSNRLEEPQEGAAQRDSGNSLTPNAMLEETVPILRPNPGGIVHFPKQRSLHTVLSGPHVHKKSREQFEIIRRQVRIEFELDQAKAELFYTLVKNMYFTGCQLQVRMKTDAYLFPAH